MLVVPLNSWAPTKLKDSNSKGVSDIVAWSSEELAGGLSSCVSCTKAVDVKVVEVGMEVLVLVEVGLEVLVLVEVGMEVLVGEGLEVVVKVVVEVEVISAVGAGNNLAGD